MKKSKVLSVVTSALVSSMLLTACGDTDNNIPATAEVSYAAGGEEVYSDIGLLPALSEAEQGKPGHLTTPRSNYVQYPYADGEGITLTYWLIVPNNVQNNPATSDSVANTQWAQLWEENTGIHIEWQGPTSDTDTAFSLMTTNAKLPDIIEWEWTGSYNGGPSAAEADGVLIWLDNYITPDGPAADLWQYLQDNPTLDKAVKTDDGHYYCFPFTRGDLYLQTTSGPIVRADLLAEAGFTDLDAIVTIDDWTEMLTALKDMGVEKPLTTQSWNDLRVIFQSAYGFRPDFYIDHETGQVKYGYIQEGYKEFLRLMREWNEAGLVDADIITNTSRDRQANMLTPLTDGRTMPISAVTYGAGGGQIGTWNQAAWKERNEGNPIYGENFELTGIQFPVLKEGDVVRYSGGSPDYAITSQVHAAITADSEYPEVAAAFLNWCYSEQGHQIINFGVEGVDYTRNADGTITYSDWIMDGGDGLGIAVAMANRGRANMSGAFVQDPNYIIAYWNTEQQQRAQHLWNDYTDNQWTILPAITLNADESWEYGAIMNDINTEIGTFYSNMFNGTKYQGETDLDVAWDKYITQIEDMGINDALAIQQAALDRYNER